MRNWFLSGLLLIILLSGCGVSAQPSVAQSTTQSPAQVLPEKEPKRLRVTQQFGLGYAAMTIADELGFLEKYSPDLKVTWIQLNSDEAIMEAFNNGQIDAAVITIPAFLKGWDQGIQWKVASGMSVMPITLQTIDEKVKTLADFGQNDKLAVSSLGSIEHVLLSMALEKELGDVASLDDNVMLMSHQEALAAMAERDITAHFSPPPYNFEESALSNVSPVVDGVTAYGAEFSYLVAVASDELYENNPNAYAALVMAIAEATEFIHENPEEAATILSPSLGLEKSVVLEYLTWPGMNYVTTPLGLLGFSDFMLRTEFITRAPEGLKDIAFSNVLAAVGEKQGEAGPLETLQSRPE